MVVCLVAEATQSTVVDSGAMSWGGGALQPRRDKTGTNLTLKRRLAGLVAGLSVYCTVTVTLYARHLS